MGLELPRGWPVQNVAHGAVGGGQREDDAGLAPAVPFEGEAPPAGWCAADLEHVEGEILDQPGVADDVDERLAQGGIVLQNAEVGRVILLHPRADDAEVAEVAGEFGVAHAGHGFVGLPETGEFLGAERGRVNAIVEPERDAQACELRRDGAAPGCRAGQADDADGEMREGVHAGPGGRPEDAMVGRAGRGIYEPGIVKFGLGCRSGLRTSQGRLKDSASFDSAATRPAQDEGDGGERYVQTLRMKSMGAGKKR